MVGLCGEPLLFWGLPNTLQSPPPSTLGVQVYTQGQTGTWDIFCVTIAGPLWDPGFANTVTPATAPGSTYRGYRNGYRALHWSRGHRYPGMETPPSGSMSRGASSLRSHPWTHVLPVREWKSHTLVQQEFVSPPPSLGGVPGRRLGSLTAT